MVNEFATAGPAGDGAIGQSAVGLAGQVAGFAPLTRRIGALHPPGTSATSPQPDAKLREQTGQGNIR